MQRMPAVAGQFYPGTQSEIEKQLRLWGHCSFEKRAAALILPHAGWFYSGAMAYRALCKHVDFDAVRRVLICCPNHRVPVTGLVTCSHSSFQTPLGEILVDTQSRDKLLELGGVSVSNDAHLHEHAIEVILVLLKAIRSNRQCRFIPIIYGHANPDKLSKVTSALTMDPTSAEDLIIISSDLSHFLDHRQAKLIDEKTIDSIVAGDAPITSEQACGCYAINGLLQWAKEQGLKSQALEYYDSSVMSGEQRRVVGYGTVAFFPG